MKDVLIWREEVKLCPPPASPGAQWAHSHLWGITHCHCRSQGESVIFRTWVLRLDQFNFLTITRVLNNQSIKHFCTQFSASKPSPSIPQGEVGMTPFSLDSQTVHSFFSLGRTEATGLALQSEMHSPTTTQHQLIIFLNTSRDVFPSPSTATATTELSLDRFPSVFNLLGSIWFLKPKC